MKIEIREGKATLDGYVNAVERDSNIMLDNSGHRFIERIRAGTFSKALERAQDIPMLLNHNEDRVLASTQNQNLILYEDNIGLRATAEVVDSEVIQKAKSGKLRGWSFGFVPIEELSIESENGIRKRTIKDLDLLEVSLIDERRIPAYVGTSVELRAEKKRMIEFRNQDFGKVNLKVSEKFEEKVNGKTKELEKISEKTKGFEKTEGKIIGGAKTKEKIETEEVNEEKIEIKEANEEKTEERAKKEKKQIDYLKFEEIIKSLERT